jgi:sphingomyelin phosphodiesterase acid-like 3
MRHLMRSMRFFFIFCLFISMSFSAFAEEKIASDKKDIAFLTLADIHFDPFVNCYDKGEKSCELIQLLRNAPAAKWPQILRENEKELSAYRQDSNYLLISSALTDARKNADSNHVKFILILGDFIGHDFRKYYQKYSGDQSYYGYQSFVRKSYEFISQQLGEAFPNQDIYVVVGNNDSYEKDYYTSPNSLFFTETGFLWSKLIKNKNANIMRASYNKAGYYAVDLPGTDNQLRLIALNTVLFSTNARGKRIQNAANVELDWLHDQLALAKANHQKVLIAMHIPAGIDVYATLRIKLFTLIELWKKPYLERFEAELRQYAEQIAGIFAGHLHSDWFQILTFDQQEIPISGTPAISPIFGNNPGYKIYHYSLLTHQLKDYETFYYPLAESKAWALEYDFNQIYQATCKECQLAAGMKLLGKEGGLAEKYKQFYAVGTDSQPISTEYIPYYWCAVHEINATDYKICTA